jgi:hypothetical protein
MTESRYNRRWVGRSVSQSVSQSVSPSWCRAGAHDQILRKFMWVSQRSNISVRTRNLEYYPTKYDLSMFRCCATLQLIEHKTECRYSPSWEHNIKEYNTNCYKADTINTVGK